MTIAEVLETAGVSGAVTAVLFVIADFWKPFFATYLGKKGERLANAEDIEKILIEVRSVTAETETIKAQISGGLWERQTLWHKRVEAYSEALGKLTGLVMAYSSLAVVKKRSAADEANKDLRSKLISKLETFALSFNEVFTALNMASLFAGADLIGELQTLSIAISELDIDDPRREALDGIAFRITVVNKKMVDEIRFDRTR